MSEQPPKSKSTSFYAQSELGIRSEQVYIRGPAPEGRPNAIPTVSQGDNRNVERVGLLSEGAYGIKDSKDRNASGSKVVPSGLSQTMSKPPVLHHTEDEMELLLRKAPNRESYCMLHYNNINHPELILFDIKNQRLQHIYNDEMEDLEKNFSDTKKIFDNRSYKYELLIAFWISVHLEKLNYAQYVYSLDPIIEKILTNLRKNNFSSPTKDAGNSLKKLKKQPIGESSLDMNDKVGISTVDELKEIKELLKQPCGITYNTNVMRIALNLQEERIACMILSYYKTKIDEEMILRAIKTGQLDYLYCVFAYNRNFQELIPPDDNSSQGKTINNHNNGASDFLDTDLNRFKVFTFEYLIKKVLDYGEDQGQSRVRQIAHWGIKTTENVLRALLKNHMDHIANEISTFYIDNADKDLLIFALDNFNEHFLKFALRNSIIGLNLMTQPSVIEHVLGLFKKGAKSELILNVLLFSDFTRWEQINLRALLEMIKEIVNEEHEQNRILLCYNPILTIALGSEYLNKISDVKNIFRHECNIVKSQLMQLGENIIENLEDDKIEQVFLDADFKDRTVLKIATMNDFAPLCASDKVNVLLQEIWEGKKTYECDGQITDFSIINYLATSKIQKVKGKRLTFKELVTQNFAVAIDEQKYWFQFKFRSHSISYFFIKDFISALGMVILFQYINFQYLQLFQNNDFEGFTEESKYIFAQDKLNEYNKVNYLGTIFSATLVLHLITKFIFNLCVDVKIPLDKWSMIDLVSSFFNIICFNVIGKTKPEAILDPSKKETLDYYVIAVVIVSWLRFFGYFLVIRSISKFLSTLIKMLVDALSFILIMCSYLLLMATIFTTLFGEAFGEGQYASISISLRTLFDAMMGAYAYTDNESYSMSNSILTIIHVFISNIFLLNFLVAILSTVYEIMEEHGEFSFKRNKYEFIEKYSIAMLDPNGYSELIIHPPPINIFSFFILPWIIKPQLMKQAADNFSKFMFWAENILYIFAFIVNELILFPLIYLKVAINVSYLAHWLKLLPLLLFWLLVGPFVLLYSLAKDIFFYIKLLCDYQDEEDQFKEKEEEDFKQDKIVIYNEVIDVMQSIVHIYRRKLLEARGLQKQTIEQLQQSAEQVESELMAEIEMGNSIQMEKSSLSMEKTLIMEAWSRYRPSTQQNSPRNQHVNMGRKNQRNIFLIYGEQFTNRIIAGIKQRTYMTKEEKLNQNGDAENNNNNHILKKLLINQNEEDLEINDNYYDNLNIPQEEIQLVEDFLDKFVFVSDSSSFGEQVDLNLALKALPHKVDESNIYRIDLMNFNLVQRSLIAFQNNAQDELFEFYDNRNKQRLQKISKRASENDFNTQEIKNLAQLCLVGFSKLQKMIGTPEYALPSESPEQQRLLQQISKRFDKN